MKKKILDSETAQIKIQRMAYEVLEENSEETELIIAGIRESGRVIAQALYQQLQQISSLKLTLLEVFLDKKKPSQVSLSEKPPFHQKVILLVDDVSNSGRTLLYALQPFLHDHPKKIQTLVLVERTHKAFQIGRAHV